jgi:peptidoglycan hydrolase-like protein with peptidoglycan-binding domain
MLKFSPFAGSVAMNTVARGKASIRFGAHGHPVGLLQAALIDAGYKLPRSSRRGAPDGVFGPETAAALKAFQSKAGLVADGTAGKKTISALDALLSPKGAPPPPKPARPEAPTEPGVYQMGSSDPPLHHDKGAGRWRSQQPTAMMAYTKVAVLMHISEIGALIGRDAARHMEHYLGNSGQPYAIDLEAMVRDVPSAKDALAQEIQAAQMYVESLPPGRYEIAATTTQAPYNTDTESKNWYYAVAGYVSWGKGIATVSEVSGRREYVLDFEYKVYDRYNWDHGKSAEVFGITIRDDMVGDWHRQGLAQEYDLFGSLKRRLTWKQGERIHLHLQKKALADRIPGAKARI